MLGLNALEHDTIFLKSAVPLLLAARTKKPLFLLPRRIGPFRNAIINETARKILGHARMVWAWDAHTLEQMRTLLGSALDPSRHQLGADPAFVLWSSPVQLDPERLPWFSAQIDRDRPPVIGIEVCGNLARRRRSAHERRADARYAQALADIVATMLLETSASCCCLRRTVRLSQNTNAQRLWNARDRAAVCVSGRESRSSRMRWSLLSGAGSKVVWTGSADQVKTP